MSEKRGKGFSFEPRTLVSPSSSFGRVSADLEPADGVEATDPRFRAALLQHHLSNTLREYLLSSADLSVEWLASDAAGHPGVSVARMQRMLRGETQMQLADLTLITSLLPRALHQAVQWLGYDLDAKDLELQRLRHEIAARDERIRGLQAARVQAR